MNTLQTILVAVCASGGAACLIFCLAYHFRNELRQLHERWLRMSPLSRTMCVFSLTLAVLYAGTKPPSTTNEPPSGVEGDAPATTNEPPEIVNGDPAPTNTPPPMLCFSPRPMMSPPRELTANNQQLTTNIPWHVRGAYCDWIHITFPSGFTFPSGTNLLTGVTVMAWGELRASLHQPPTNNQQLTTLPKAVSLVPDESTFAHGPTASNSYVFAWDDVCVEREATNRVNASIELFDTGDMTMRFGSTVTNIAARPPEGFSGLNQDDAWIAANFPNDYNAITNKGYSAWLMEDKVGYNEPNGLYKVDVTIAALPDHGPCYLVVGPHKMTVNHPGTYSFPLEVFVEYRARTYPEAVPLSFEYDDGYSVDPVPGWVMMSGSSAARPRLLGAPRNDNDYRISYDGRIYCDPSWIDFGSAEGRSIYLSCNASHVSQITYESSDPGLEMTLRSFSRAEIVRVLVGGFVTFVANCGEHTAFGSVYVSQPWPPYTPDPDPDGTNDNHNATGTNDVDNTSSTNSNQSASEP